MNNARLFVITIIFFINRYQSKTSGISRHLHSNQYAYDKICFNHNYTAEKLNQRYATADNYINSNYKNANDEDNYSKSFYLELITTGKVNNLSAFFKGNSIGYLFVFVAAFGVLSSINNYNHIAWLSFDVLWCCNCCLFIKEHDLSKCRLGPYIIVVTLFSLAFVLLVISLSISKYYHINVVFS